jgi:hypothetical protein
MEATSPLRRQTLKKHIESNPIDDHRNDNAPRRDSDFTESSMATDTENESIEDLDPNKSPELEAAELEAKAAHFRKTIMQRLNTYFKMNPK